METHSGFVTSLYFQRNNLSTGKEADPTRQTNLLGARRIEMHMVCGAEGCSTKPLLLRHVHFYALYWDMCSRNNSTCISGGGYAACAAVMSGAREHVQQVGSGLSAEFSRIPVPMHHTHFATYLP